MRLILRSNVPLQAECTICTLEAGINNTLLISILISGQIKLAFVNSLGGKVTVYDLVSTL